MSDFNKAYLCLRDSKCVLDQMSLNTFLDELGAESGDEFQALAESDRNALQEICDQICHLVRVAKRPMFLHLVGLPSPLPRVAVSEYCAAFSYVNDAKFVSDAIAMQTLLTELGVEIGEKLAMLDEAYLQQIFKLIKPMKKPGFKKLMNMKS